MAPVFTTFEEANQALRALIGALGNLAETPDLLDKVKSGIATGVVGLVSLTRLPDKIVQPASGTGQRTGRAAAITRE